MAMATSNRGRACDNDAGTGEGTHERRGIGRRNLPKDTVGERGWCKVSVHEPSDWNSEKQAIRAAVANNCKRLDERQRKNGAILFLPRRLRWRVPRLVAPFHSPQVRTGPSPFHARVSQIHPARRAMHLHVRMHAFPARACRRTRLRRTKNRSATPDTRTSATVAFPSIVNTWLTMGPPLISRRS